MAVYAPRCRFWPQEALGVCQSDSLYLQGSSVEYPQSEFWIRFWSSHRESKQNIQTAEMLFKESIDAFNLACAVRCIQRHESRSVLLIYA